MDQVAQTMLAQLGGNKFIAMTGARLLTYNGATRTLSMRLPQGKCNLVRLTLTAADDYTLTGFKVRGPKFKQVAEHTGVYDTDLRQFFETMTGLRTRLV